MIIVAKDAIYKIDDLRVGTTRNAACRRKLNSGRYIRLNTYMRIPTMSRSWE